MNDNTWIQELKVGDVVYVSGNYGETPPRYKVGRLTNTRVMVDIGKNLSCGTVELPFRKDNGWMVGADKWSRAYLIKATPEVEAKYYLRNINVSALKLLGQLAKHTFTEQEAQEVIDFCAAMKNRIEARLNEVKV